MASILTNTSAMVALATLNDVNRGLTETQNRVSSGLKISSGKDNAAYFAISMTMKGDSGMFRAVNEGLTTTKNAISTGRLGAETVADLALQFTERVAFAQGSGLDLADVQNELDGFIDRMNAALAQATFNGSNLIDSTDSVTVVTGISRASGSFATTTVTFSEVDLGAIVTALDSLIDTLDAGVGAMVDADMEEEAARLQAFQVQQQLAIQSLSIANQSPQNVLSLFR